MRIHIENEVEVPNKKYLAKVREYFSAQYENDTRPVWQMVEGEGHPVGTGHFVKMAFIYLDSTSQVNDGEPVFYDSFDGQITARCMESAGVVNTPEHFNGDLEEKEEEMWVTNDGRKVYIDFIFIDVPSNSSFKVGEIMPPTKNQLEPANTRAIVLDSKIMNPPLR